MTTSTRPATPPEDATPAEVARRGVEICRQGDWKEGMYWLSMAAGARDEKTEMPSLFFAYLGFGAARYQGRIGDGVTLCRHAVELEHYQPENYYFLARTLLLMEDRRQAIDVVERGLQIDATNEDLVRLRTELGLRRSPVLPFLARGNPLNRALGKLRHRLRRRPKPPAPTAP